ncbi:MAG: c-type cytochrome [Gammaproteobacteria bacterium]|nr:c-type cytochrome [Gammaproteobacteria bacterium]
MQLSSTVAADANHHHGQNHEKHHGHNQLKSHTGSIKKPKKSRWGTDYFPNITLITQDGKKVKFFDDLIKDKVVAINFIFTSCDDSCPLETARLRQVQKILGDRVGRDVFMYSISIDPKVDTPSVLTEYMKKFKVGPGWTFLTGNEEEIITLRRKLGLYIEEIQNDKENPDDHNLSLVIGNQKTGRWMKRSPFENPYVLASQLGDWLHNWERKPDMHKNYANAPKVRQISPGEALFRTRCSSCHSYGKDGVGPDLLNVTKKRDRAWLTRWLQEPDKMLAEKDPLALRLFERYKIPMPNMRLTPKDVEDMLSYMEGEDARLENATTAKAEDL